MNFDSLKSAFFPVFLPVAVIQYIKNGNEGEKVFISLYSCLLQFITEGKYLEEVCHIITV